MHTSPAQMEQRPKKSAMTSLQPYQLIDLSTRYEWLTDCECLSVFVCAGGSVWLIQVTCVNDVHDLTSAAKIFNSMLQDHMMKSVVSSSPASGLDLQETDVRGNTWWCQTSVMHSLCKYRGVRVTTGCVEKNECFKEGSSGEIRNHLKKEESWTSAPLLVFRSVPSACLYSSSAAL